MRRRTKIVATLGPATDDIAVLSDMVRAGLDVARVNFSHGQQSEQLRRIELVREAARRAGKIVGILAEGVTLPRERLAADATRFLAELEQQAC